MQRELPQLGFGLGLRAKHYPHVFEHKPDVDWFEIISENFMDTDGRPRRKLERAREMYPIVMHGVSLSIGTVDPLNSEYLRKLKDLKDWLKPAWISDHLCWTGVAHKNTHDLLPVPYTEEALRHIVQRIREVQDYLECPIALENPSTYLEFKTSHIPEAEFIARMAEEADCNLLLDVNNVYVTCYNHRLDAKEYLDTLPMERVVQIHLAGHTNKGTHIVDTHDDHVVDEVWNLYKYVVASAGRVPNTMIEWDDKIPDFPVLAAELDKARVAAAGPDDYVLPELAQDQAPQVVNRITPLPDAQTQLQTAIMQGRAHDSHPQSWIRAKDDFAPQAQLDVYINAYRYRLFDVVAEDYTTLRHYLGGAAFDALIHDFVNSERPDHFNIARFAAKLPAFIRQSRPDDVFAHELCDLETLIAQLADAPETQALTQEDFAQVSPDELMQMVLHPRVALRLVTFTHPVNAYFQAVMDDENPPAPAPEASHMAVFRHEDSMWRMVLDADEYALLAQLFTGVTVGEALQDLDEGSAMHLTDWFARWIRNGLLAAPSPERTKELETSHESA